MEEKTFTIIDKTGSILTEAIRFFLTKEDWIEVKPDMTENIILINIEDYNDASNIEKKFVAINSSLGVDYNPTRINYLFVQDDKVSDNDTPALKTFEFERGVYLPLNQTVLNLLGEDYAYLNNASIDLTEVSPNNRELLFEFNSIHESYNWLNNNNLTSKNQRLVEVTKENVHDDSDNEIRYLSNRIRSIQSGLNLEEVFVATKDQKKRLMNNYFFKQLKKNICSNYTAYFIEREELIQKAPELNELVGWGFAIYDHSVFVDNKNSKNTLGYVDLNETTRKKYDEAFEKLITVAHKLKKDD